MSKPSSKPTPAEEAEAKPAVPVTVVTTIEDVADATAEAEGSSPYAREPEVEVTKFGNGTTEEHYV
jgi:hypothetical protein